MKKIGISLILCFLAVAGFVGYRYYAQTYATHLEYAHLTAQTPAKTQVKDAHGNLAPNHYRYQYTLTFYDEKGQAHQRDCEVRGDQNVEPLPVNAYIKMLTSETRSQTPQVISENQVPKKIRTKLNH